MVVVGGDWPNGFLVVFQMIIPFLGLNFLQFLSCSSICSLSCLLFHSNSFVGCLFLHYYGFLRETEKLNVVGGCLLFPFSGFSLSFCRFPAKDITHFSVFAELILAIRNALKQAIL